MSDAAIRIEGVTKTFGTKVAVNKLDLVVPTGTVCGFLGPNGAGKTTTIRMVMSIIYPDEGRISVLGKPTASESKDRIGYLPEERGVYRKMKVGEFVGFIARLKGVDSAGLSKKIDDWLERVALPDVKKKRCEELSKGMQQKVQFLAAVIHDPELIILDEPFSGLDPVNARLLRSLIDEMHRAGKTIIFSTHVLASADAICDRVFMINKGRKVLDGPIEGVRAEFDPKTIIAEPITDNGESAERILGSAPGVHSVTRVRDAAGVYEAHLEEGVDPTPAMQSIVAAMPLRRIEVRRATLEDIFVHLVDPGDSEDIVRASLSGDAANVEAAANA
ncbi:MAG: ATP-binding cassette domain-containing protein [Planctomycetota bacterium]|nr:ATP-binding cassette domain-containing protein [Planctomycetota bacterium]